VVGHPHRLIGTGSRRRRRDDERKRFLAGGAELEFDAERDGEAASVVRPAGKVQWHTLACPVASSNRISDPSGAIASASVLGVAAGKRVVTRPLPG